MFGLKHSTAYLDGPAPALWRSVCDVWLTAPEWLALHRRGFTPVIYVQRGEHWYRGCPPRPWVAPRRSLAILASTRRVGRLP